MITSDLERKIEKAVELKALGYMISYLNGWLNVFKEVEATEGKTESELAYQRGRYDALRMALDAAMRAQIELLKEGA